MNSFPVTESSLYFWNKPNWAMVYYLFNVMLDSICKYVTYHFYISIHKKSKIIVFWCFHVLVLVLVSL